MHHRDFNAHKSLRAVPRRHVTAVREYDRQLRRKARKDFLLVVLYTLTCVYLSLRFMEWLI